MNHPVAVCAQYGEILELGLGLSRLVERGAVVNFAVIAAMVPVHKSEVKTTDFAFEGLTSSAHRVDLPLPQASVALAN